VCIRESYGASPSPKEIVLCVSSEDERSLLFDSMSPSAARGTEASVVETGRRAPDFTLESDTGERVTLSALRGRPVVLYFYPKDDTPGCTTQACGIRDAWGEFEQRGAVVLGVSPDSA
jgi:peroxiredoxin Q/BCP